MAKPADIINRDTEWTELQGLVNDRRPHLVFVTGRRRIGKSYILARLMRENDGIYYQATRRTEAEQIAALSRQIGERFDDVLQHNVSFSTWEDLFAYLIRRASKRPVTLVIDEFPYLAAAAPALTSIIQSIWDHDWQKKPLKLILSGSYITAMKQLEEADQPLFGRRTAKLAFAPFSSRDVKHFLPTYGVRDQLRTYGIFGALPGNLVLLDTSRALAENSASLLLRPTGRLVDEAEHILDTFLGEADVHYSILSAIAQGEQTWSGITNRVGKSGSSISRPLQWLDEMEIVKRIVPISEKNPAKARRAIYRITDPYIAFWHRFVEPLVRSGTVGLADPAELWAEYVEPRIDEHMGPVFEQICRDYVRRKGALPFSPVRVGEWWDSTSDNQVDVVAIGSRGELLVGEAKWGAVTQEDLTKLRQRALLLAAEVGGVSRIYHALFTSDGRIDAAIGSQPDVLIVTGEDIIV